MDIDWTEPPRRRIVAQAVIRNTRGGVLLVNTNSRDYWHLPGGGVHANEDPHIACQREIHEETGLDLPLAGLLLVDYVPATDTAAEGISLVYDGGIIPGDTKIVLPNTDRPGDRPEVISTTWADPHDLSRYTTQAHRAQAALRVLAHADAARYLVKGRPVLPSTASPAAA
ncbi:MULTISPECIES: NUDIX hydrolase [unclassified Streptomyces]|uniref:NUDIX hydrolase n=1 Tax=unclassified Streptomyces TaxID=2593676 RepID=UPI002E2A099A|nr:NUDIX hydrolase [Streptomyces sp. NBC_00223]